MLQALVRGALSLLHLSPSISIPQTGNYTEEAAWGLCLVAAVLCSSRLAAEGCVFISVLEPVSRRGWVGHVLGSF